MLEEVAGSQVAHQGFVDGQAFEHKVVDILGARHLGDGHLIFNRTRLLLRDLGGEQIADDVLKRWSMLTILLARLGDVVRESFNYFDNGCLMKPKNLKRIALQFLKLSPLRHRQLYDSIRQVKELDVSDNLINLEVICFNRYIVGAALSMSRQPGFFDIDDRLRWLGDLGV